MKIGTVDIPSKQARMETVDIPSKQARMETVDIPSKQACMEAAFNKAPFLLNNGCINCNWSMNKLF